MANYVALFSLMILFLWSFFRIVKSSIDMGVAMRSKNLEDKERLSLIDKGQKRILSSILNMFLTTGCMGFLVENELTSKLAINLLVAYLTMTLIITLHEFGHYFFGKRCGLKIEKYTVGLGATLFKKKWKETTFTLKLIPFLGFVQPASMEEFKGLKSRQKLLFFSGGLIVNYLLYTLGVVMALLEKGHSVLFGLKQSYTKLITIAVDIVQNFSWDIVYSPKQSFDSQVQGMLGLSEYFAQFWAAFAIMNLFLFIMNALPIPPLDGGHITKELLEKTLKTLLLPRKFVRFVIGFFVGTGLLFFASRMVVNNGWAMINDLHGRWIEFSLWLLLLISIVGYFTERKVDKSNKIPQ